MMQPQQMMGQVKIDQSNQMMGQKQVIGSAVMQGQQMQGHVQNINVQQHQAQSMAAAQNINAQTQNMGIQGQNIGVQSQNIQNQVQNQVQIQPIQQQQQQQQQNNQMQQIGIDQSGQIQFMNSAPQGTPTNFTQVQQNQQMKVVHNVQQQQIPVGFFILFCSFFVFVIRYLFSHFIKLQTLLSNSNQ